MLFACKQRPEDDGGVDVGELNPVFLPPISPQNRAFKKYNPRFQKLCHTKRVLLVMGQVGAHLLDQGTMGLSVLM
jgi:hypothetical protein